MANGLPSTDMWLLLGNIFICANDGYNYKLKQITQYDWLTKDMIEICHKNIRTNISQDASTRAIFELELGYKFDGIAYYQLEHKIFGKIKLRGRIDCITDDTVWEFKCMESLNLESMLQLAIYAWIWKGMILKHDANKEKIAKQLAEANQSSTATKDEIARKAKIMDNDTADYDTVGYDTYLEKAHKTTREELFHPRAFKLMNGHILK